MCKVVSKLLVAFIFLTTGCTDPTNVQEKPVSYAKVIDENCTYKMTTQPDDVLQILLLTAEFTENKYGLGILPLQFWEEIFFVSDCDESVMKTFFKNNLDEKKYNELGFERVSKQEFIENLDEAQNPPSERKKFPMRRLPL